MAANGAGVIGVGVRTLNEAGTVADWSREQVELFCISKLINCVLEPDEEFVFLDFHFAMRKLSLESFTFIIWVLLLTKMSFRTLGPKHFLCQSK